MINAGTSLLRRTVLGAGLGAATVAGFLGLTGAAVAQEDASQPSRRVESLGVPWEDAYGYVQAVQVGDTIYVSGQLSHDDQGNLVAPAPLDASGQQTDASNMEAQMAATYDNAKALLARFDATLDDVVSETIYTTNLDATFAVAGPVRKAAYGTDVPQVTSTLVGVTRLAFPEQLVEVALIVVLDR